MNESNRRKIANFMRVPKRMRADAVNRTFVVVVRTMGSRTVTPLTVCGNDEAAAFVSSASVTVSVNVDGGAVVAVPLADGSGVAERVGGAPFGDEVGLGDGKTTRDGAHSRTSRNTAAITTARSASRARDDTR